MHERYEDPDLKNIWNDTRKFAEWREVEIHVLGARAGLEEIPGHLVLEVQELTEVDDEVARLIKRRDKATKHDLNAFVEVMRLQLILRQSGQDFWKVVKGWPEKDFQEKFSETLRTGCPAADVFHDGMTSYDTEEPAMAVLLNDASHVILFRLSGLDHAIAQLARKYRGVPMMGRTHGQWAQPITFGVKALNWLDGLRLARERLGAARRDAAVIKLSGAVGMYGTLGPEVEDAVSRRLQLPSVIATQIVGLGRKAHLVVVLAELATEIGKIAHDLWLMAQSEVGEVREPFDKGQKGSSAMPHKKNPITIEQCFGLPRLVRACAQAMLENVDTHHERDISQSSVERNAVPDAFHATGHLIRRLTGIIEKMDVFPERMQRNIDRSCGIYASQAVERFLKERGMNAETAYRIVQEACFQAVTTETHLTKVLRDRPEINAVVPGIGAFQDLFDPRGWIRHEEAVYRRFDARWSGFPPILADG